MVNRLSMDFSVLSPRLPKTGATFFMDAIATLAGGKGGHQPVACARKNGRGRMVGLAQSPPHLGRGGGVQVTKKHASEHNPAHPVHGVGRAAAGGSIAGGFANFEGMIPGAAAHLRIAAALSGSPIAQPWLLDGNSINGSSGDPP